MSAPENRVGFFSLSAYFFVLCICLVALSCVLALFLVPAPAFRPSGRVPWALAVGAALALLSFFWGRFLHKRLGRPFLLFQGAVASLVLVASGALETAARFRLPPWPARDLHGDVRIGPGVNSWGQRDRERLLAPAPGISRIALTGGTHLDDLPTPPLSRLLDERVGAPYEFVNLGVRGQSFRETYWRIRGVAVPLGAERVFAFLDPVRDLVFPSSADTKLAPHLARLALDRPPRGSLFGQLFPGLTHALLPVSRTELPPTDRDWSARLRRVGTEDLPALLSRLAGARASELPPSLGRVPLTSLRRALVRPDGGALDPAFLRRLLLSLGNGSESPVDDGVLESTARWILGAARVSRQNRIAFTLVWIPPPEIDERIREQWLPIGDLRVGAKRWAGVLERLRGLLGDRVEILDLSSDLSDIRGSYLSGTGLWSPAALERVAARIGDRVSPGSAPRPLP